MKCKKSILICDSNTSSDKYDNHNYFNSLLDVRHEKHYDLSEFESAMERLCWYIEKEHPEGEVGIVVTMDDGGDWYSGNVIVGTHNSVEYDFSEYFSRDPEVNEGLRFPQGTVHYHPLIDSIHNYLPSIGDILNSADMASIIGEFVCGVVNHEGKMIIAIVNRNTRKDATFEEYIARYNVAFNSGNRAEVIRLEFECINYLREKGMIKLYRYTQDR
ncbi:MAG: hypothetical protein P1Q69_10500 [Candidatus Thorarchaeota archaeon]|nr:hypothetical protein [Candidatus Thorarchaeota archaeon]